MNIVFVIVGIDKWEEWTLPLLEDIERHYGNAEVVVVDNGSEASYPRTGHIDMRLPETVCYAEALNEGIGTALALTDLDWLVLLNSDVKISKQMNFKHLNKDALHGFAPAPTIEGHIYLPSWALIMSLEVFQKIGYFDEEFKPMWFDDVDYSIRADKLGIQLIAHDSTESGFLHLDRKEHKDTRRESNREAYNRNRAYLKEKHGL